MINGVMSPWMVRPDWRAGVSDSRKRQHARRIEAVPHKAQLLKCDRQFRTGEHEFLRAAPPELRKAHHANDRAVMAAYGFDPELPEHEIVAELFRLYRELAE